MTTELNTVNIFEFTQQVFQDLSNDSDVNNQDMPTFTQAIILSIQGPCLQNILRLNRLILPETELNANERYEKLFKFILWYCLIHSPKAREQGYQAGTGLLIRSIDELNVAYNFFNTTVLQSQRHQLLTRGRRRPRSSPRSITDESSPQRRRMSLSIDTQLANASFNDNMYNDVGEDLEIQGITAGLPTNTQIVAETTPNQTQTNSSSLSNIIRNVAQLSPFVPIQIQQSEEVAAASGQSRQPTPHPHTTSGLNLPSPGSSSSAPPTPQQSVNRRRRQRRFAMNLPSAANVREIIERGGIVPPSPDLSETGTESILGTVSTTTGGTSTTSATDIVASSQPSIGSPQQVQRTEQLSFDQLLNQIRLYPEASLDFTSLIQSLTLFSRIMTNISNHEPGFIPTVSSESFQHYINNVLEVNQYNLPHAPSLMFMYLYVLLRILNDPVSIKYITMSEGVENTHFLDFKNQTKENTEYCHGQHDMITLDIFDTTIKDIIYIEGPGPNEKHCYERTSFLRMLEKNKQQRKKN